MAQQAPAWQSAGVVPIAAAISKIAVAIAPLVSVLKPDKSPG